MNHRDTVRFLLGDEVQALSGVDPTGTVLDWLRLDKRLTGTKEGCAEGDCGACTVVVGRRDGGRVLYEAVNACIRFLPTLDGCHLLTVEHLAETGGALHPVQQAMVEKNGSQCGFCTPGFIMSLFALYLNEARPDSERISDALAGNLCRCTGYAPIAAAARSMYDLPAAGKSLTIEAETLAARLGMAETDDVLVIESGGRRFISPGTTDTLANAMLAYPDATIVSGATDVGLWVTKQQRVLPTIVYVGRIAEMRRVVETDETLEIGAAATFTEAGAALAGLYPDLGELFRRLGGLQVRNAGTIGGNIANGSPIGDSPPALIAIGASIVLRRGQTRRILPLEEFFIAYGKQDRTPGEFVERISVPKPSPAARFRAYKISKRFDQDISALCGAFLIERDHGKVARARIAYGGMAGTPKRAVHAEAALLGRDWTTDAAQAAMAALTQDFTPLSDWRASAAYRGKVAANLLMKFFIETSGDTAETRLVGDRSIAHA